MTRLSELIRFILLNQWQIRSRVVDHHKTVQRLQQDFRNCWSHKLSRKFVVVLLGWQPFWQKWVCRGVHTDSDGNVWLFCSKVNKYSLPPTHFYRVNNRILGNANQFTEKQTWILYHQPNFGRVHKT